MNSRAASRSNKARSLGRAGYIVIVAAGTSDLAVAEEAGVTAEFMGNEVRRIYDVGVSACIDSCAAARDSSANVVIAVAGMEAALPTVIAG